MKCDKHSCPELIETSDKALTLKNVFKGSKSSCLS